jgi:plastocyanin
VRFAVNPSRIIVQAGTPVTWINIDDPPHQFCVEGADVKTEYLMLKGQTGTVVLKEPGTYHTMETPSIQLSPLSQVSLRCGSDSPERIATPLNRTERD